MISNYHIVLINQKLARDKNNKKRPGYPGCHDKSIQ